MADQPMEFGVGIFFTDYSISPAKLAVALEERGLDVLWAPEHSHISVSRQTGPDGGALDKRYFDVMDPFVTLTAAAAATKRLKVGTGVCLIIQRDTIQGQAHRFDRSGVRRTFFVRHRRWLEQGRNRGPWHRLHHPHAEDAR